MAKFRLTPEALNDIDQIWYRIYPDNPTAADSVESAIFAAIRTVAASPTIGHTHPAIAKRPLRFWTVTSYPNYIIAYEPNDRPIRIVRVLHGKRNLNRLFRKYS